MNRFGFLLITRSTATNFCCIIFPPSHKLCALILNDLQSHFRNKPARFTLHGIAPFSLATFRVTDVKRVSGACHGHKRQPAQPLGQRLASPSD